MSEKPLFPSKPAPREEGKAPGAPSSFAPKAAAPAPFATRDAATGAIPERKPLFPARDPAAPSPFAPQPGLAGTGVTGTGVTGAGATGTGMAPERKPLFPPRDPAAPSPFATRDAKADAAPERKPLFPPRDPAAPSPFAPQPGGAGMASERKPLFPPRDPAAPSPFAPKPGLGGTGTAGIETKSLFPPRTETTSGMAANKPAFGTTGTTGAGTAGTGTPSFGTTAAPVFGQPKPAVPQTPLFIPPSAPGQSPAPSRNFGTPPPLSAASRKEIKLSDEEFLLLRDFLYKQSGIFVGENRKYLVENRLATRLRDLGLKSFGEYHKYLCYDANRAAELNVFYENMTTNETSFFRHQAQLDMFRDQVLARVLDEQRSKGQKKLRIWSAGCSSGEEPYTLAMILSEVLKQELSSWDIKITANDLSPAVLAIARSGVYGDYAIRTTPPDMLARYFTKEGNGLYRLDPKLQRLVQFGQINLKDNAQLQRVERSHIVFCRNVIIYFDDEMKRSVVNAFYDNLLPGGYLLVGHSESLHNLSRAFKPEHFSGSIVYRRQS